MDWPLCVNPASWKSSIMRKIIKIVVLSLLISRPIITNKNSVYMIYYKTEISESILTRRKRARATTSLEDEDLTSLYVSVIITYIDVGAKILIPFKRIFVLRWLFCGLDNFVYFFCQLGPWTNTWNSFINCNKIINYLSNMKGVAYFIDTYKFF